MLQINLLTLYIWLFWLLVMGSESHSTLSGRSWRGIRNIINKILKKMHKLLLAVVIVNDVGIIEETSSKEPIFNFNWKVLWLHLSLSHFWKAELSIVFPFQTITKSVFKDIVTPRNVGRPGLTWIIFLLIFLISSIFVLVSNEVLYFRWLTEFCSGSITSWLFEVSC